MAAGRAAVVEAAGSARATVAFAVAVVFSSADVDGLGRSVV